MKKKIPSYTLKPVSVPFFLTRNAFIKTRNRCIFLHPHPTRLFQTCTVALPQRQARAKWASVEQWDAVCGPVCAIWTILICSVCCLRRAPSPRGAPYQLQKKKNLTRHSRDRARKQRSQPVLTPHVCAWTQMIIIDGQLCPWKDNPVQREKTKTKPACHFQVGYIHNQMIIITTLTKVNHGFRSKTA